MGRVAQRVAMTLNSSLPSAMRRGTFGRLRRRKCTRACPSCDVSHHFVSQRESLGRCVIFACTRAVARSCCSRCFALLRHCQLVEVDAGPDRARQGARRRAPRVRVTSRMNSRLAFVCRVPHDYDTTDVSCMSMCYSCTCAPCLCLKQGVQYA